MTEIWHEVLMAAPHQRDAPEYVLTNGFATVTTLAGLDPDAVRYAFNRGAGRMQSPEATEHNRGLM